MPKILILADDLTGANDTGASIHELGHETYTVVDCRDRPNHLERYDCISVNLESRNMPAKEAYNRVRETTRFFEAEDTLVYSKRIDSTLRGNLGSECDALLEHLGPSAVAMIVPAFPRAGRTCRGDTVYVNGVRLEETAAAKDPKCPVTTSSPLELMRQQSANPTASIPLGIVRGSFTGLLEAVHEAIGAGIRNLLFEAEKDEDIRLAAKAAVSTGRRFAAVDPGPFTREVARLTLPSVYAGRGAVLAVVGSVNVVTQEQVKRLLEDSAVQYAVLQVPQILESPEACDAELRRAVDQLVRPGKSGVRMLMLSSVLSRERVSFRPYADREGIPEEAISQRVNAALSRAARMVLEEDGRIGALFTCGGDVTVSMCGTLGVGGMRVLGEVLPLAVCGELISRAGVPYLIVTKGGMVGGPGAITECIEHLRKRLDNKERICE